MAIVLVRFYVRVFAKRENPTNTHDEIIARAIWESTYLYFETYLF